MDMQLVFYILGSFFFFLWCVFLGVLIVGLIKIIKGVEEMQENIESKLEKMSMATKLAPVLPIILVQARKLWRQWKS